MQAFERLDVDVMVWGEVDGLGGDGFELEVKSLWLLIS
jgi:hypothetical protein